MKVEPDPVMLADHKPARKLIAEREASLKRSRARLQNPRYLELWRGASGAFQQDFRWGVTQRILSDIHQALYQGAENVDAP